MSRTVSRKSKRGECFAQVTENRRLCDEHYQLTLWAPNLPATRPGQFVEVRCSRGDRTGRPRVIEWGPGKPPNLIQPELLGTETLLRRPLSLAGRRDAQGGPEIELIYRTIGTGTRWLATVAPGEHLSLLGPLGNGFAIRPDKPFAALVGGGVGIPPMLYLAETLAAAGKRTVAFNGVRSANLLPLTLAPGGAPLDGVPTPCVAEFAARGVAAAVTTDDGSAGMKGSAGEALERWLRKSGLAPYGTVVYGCGPEPMLRAVAEVCADFGIECQLALERYMGCGLGTCQSCVVKIRDNSPAGWSFKLCCSDGPVFDANGIIWT